MSKRSLNDGATTTKRVRQVNNGPRLCDLACVDDLFCDELNETNAKEKGFLRNKAATAKFQELERKIIQLHKDAHDLEPLDEEWLMEVLPELGSLEADTLDALLGQSQRHSLYERAARELVHRERTRLETEHQSELIHLIREHQDNLAQEHEDELRQHQTEAEGKAASRKYAAELRMKMVEEEASEEAATIRAECEAKAEALEETIEEQKGTIEELEAQLEAAATEAEEERERAAEEAAAQVRELEEAAGREHDELRERAEEAEKYAEECHAEKARQAQALTQAQLEVDLKRETSTKLKEEIIDNDRLTVANLNRIKTLEAALAVEREGREALEKVVDELEADGAEAREAIAEGRHAAAANAEAEEEISHLRSELAEREAQLMSLSRRLAERSGPEERPGGGTLRELNRAPGRDGSFHGSFLDRLGGLGKSFEQRIGSVV